MNTSVQTTTLSRQAESGPRLWLVLAVGALAAAGALALLLALARAPGADAWLPSGGDFFYKALVTHVVFSFQVWLLAMLGAAAAHYAPPNRFWNTLGLAAAFAGCAALLLTTLAGWGEASLNNYVPVLDHPLYFAGLALIAGGIAVPAWRCMTAEQDTDAGFAAAAASAAYFAALICFAVAAWRIPGGTDAALYNERLFWGGGHVLQFVNSLLAMMCWLRLTQGRPRPLLRWACAALAASAFIGVYAALRYDPLGLTGRESFTQMLWYALPLPPLVVGLAVLPQAWAERRSIAGRALLLSLAVFGLGGGAGFALGIGDTRTPSHYHAMIGGVNLALMGMIHIHFLPLLNRAAPDNRWKKLQFSLYGGGQVLHALGFYLAGLAGVARKTAGSEQGLDSMFKLATMSLVGLGGAIAVLGGVMFVVQVLRRLVRHA